VRIIREVENKNRSVSRGEVYSLILERTRGTALRKVVEERRQNILRKISNERAKHIQTQSRHVTSQSRM